MKNWLRRIALFVPALCLFFQPLMSSAQQERAVPDLKNAARLYNGAFELLKYPDSKDLNSRITLVIQKGWQSEDGDLEAVLKDNEPAFKEFMKAVRLKSCDFDFGRKYKYLIQKEIPTYSKIRGLYRLNLLRARFDESKGEYDDALKIYLSNLTFANHIAQDNVMMMRMISLVIKKETCAALQDFLSSAKLSKNKYRKVYDFLLEDERTRFKPQELIQAEKEVFLSLMAMLVDTYIADTYNQNNTQANSDDKAKAVVLGEEVKKQAGQLADKYYGNFIKAIQTSSPADWDFASDELNSLIKEAQPKAEDLGGFIKAVFTDSLKDQVSAVDKKLANKIVLTMLSLTIPNFKGIGDGYYSAIAQMNELKSLVLAKING